MMRHVMMAFIQSEILTKCDIGDYDFHDFVANNVFFHDQLMKDGCVKLMRMLFFMNFLQKLLQAIH